MHHKDIKAQIRKQLKREYPNWKRLTKKEKKAIAKMVLDEVVSGYDTQKEISTDYHELLGIEKQLLNAEMMNLDQMARFIENHINSKLIKLDNRRPSPNIKDEELRFIDEILDDTIINKLLSYDGFSPAMREFSPSTFLRAELLKSIKFPEISYRKYCGDDKQCKEHKLHNDYTGIEQKQNRAFIGLPLSRRKMISHVQLSQFRSSLSFAQLVNLTVYILHQFRQYGFLDGGLIHCVDSTELAVDCSRLLASIEIQGQKIRIYDDIDCDCGKRRNKRDKSPYVVGYRMHTLTAINAKTGHSYPLISLLAPANHHDSLFLSPLVGLGKGIGLDIKLITADEAYNDKDGFLYEEAGVTLIKPPNSKVALPADVDPETMQVTLDEFCDIAMQYVGTEGKCHEFKCSAGPDECFRQGNCIKFRQIDFDDGRFQRVLYGSEEVLEALDIRKNGERPFNLLKHREGLEPVRVRSQHAILARCTFSTMSTLLLEMAGTRKKKKKQDKPAQLPLLDVAQASGK